MRRAFFVPSVVEKKSRRAIAQLFPEAAHDARIKARIDAIVLTRLILSMVKPFYDRIIFKHVLKLNAGLYLDAKIS